jgi:branched-chain amino acid transport system substrate-binding protein
MDSIIALRAYAKMTAILKSTAAAALLTCATLAGCERHEPPATAVPDMVKIGFAAPLTGPQAHYGEEMKHGVELALEDANAQSPMIGGRPVRFHLIAEDDQADPGTGVIVAQRLVDAGIAGMIGHFNSGTSIPAAAVYARAGIPQIAMATAPAYTAQGLKTTFRAMTSDRQQGSADGRFAVERAGARRIAIVDDRTAYGQGLADQVERSAKQAGGVVVSREYASDRDTDFKAILTRIKGTRPDLLFFGGADVQAATLVKQMRELGMRTQFMGGDMLKSPSFIRLAGDAAEGATASLAGSPLLEMPGGKAFAERYRARFKEDVEIYSPYAYDATRMLVAAMREADSVKPELYLPRLASIKWQGITAENISYDEHGDLRSSLITLYQVHGGEWQVRR